MIVLTAVTSHAAISSAGDPNPRDISADTMKMPDPIIEPITIAVAENSPIPCTNCGADDDPLSPGMSLLLSSRTLSGVEGDGAAVVFTKFTFRQFYRNFSRKSPATFSTDSYTTNKPLMTATESAPESITLRAVSRVIPPIATIGFFVN